MVDRRIASNDFEQYPKLTKRKENKNGILEQSVQCGEQSVLACRQCSVERVAKLADVAEVVADSWHRNSAAA